MAPMFNYSCEKCDYEGDHLVSHFDDQVECPDCGNSLEKAAAHKFNVGGSRTDSNKERIAIVGPGISPEFAIEAAKHLPEETNPGDTVRVSIDGTVYEGVATEGGHISGRVTKRP